MNYMHSFKYIAIWQEIQVYSYEVPTVPMVAL